MDYEKIGILRNTQGFQGHIVLRHDGRKKVLFKELGHLLVERVERSYIPYFLEEAKELDEGAVLLKFEEVNSVEDARELLNKAVFIEKEFVKSVGDFQIDEALVGFSLFDEGKNLGKIEQVIETPGQVLAVVTYQGHELLVPLVEQTIVSVRINEKEVHARLPEGLIDIYLKEKSDG